MTEPLKLGVLIDSSQQRDAVHVAVCPVEATERLAPGDHIGFVDDTEHVARAGSQGVTSIGIVDPFLTTAVMKGDRFWMFLYPQTITSLRHDWTHPAFTQTTQARREHPLPIPDPSVETQRAMSAQWLRDFCTQSDCPSYEVVMKAISGDDPGSVDDVYGSWGYIEPEYLHFSGRDAHSEIPPEFWHHAEIVLGDRLTRLRPTSFSCSC